IVNPQDPPASQRGPDVQGSSPGRTCTEADPCLLRSQAFVTPVSGVNVQRQFDLTVTQIVYQDETTRQTPRALVGQYRETIRNYTLDEFVQVVNGAFRLERSLPIAGAP